MSQYFLININTKNIMSISSISRKTVVFFIQCLNVSVVKIGTV